MFAPKRIYIKPQSLTSPKTKEIITRAKQIDPKVQIIELNRKDFQYPSGLTPQEKYTHMKESVIISERVESFIRTFASPGNIVENINTVLNYTWMCPLGCEYCYLQTNQTLEHYFYTNLKDLERELIAAPFAHRAILTIWSMLSIAKKQPLNKIPSGLEEFSNILREDFSEKGIKTAKAAINWLFLRQEKIYLALKGNSSEKEFGLSNAEFKYSFPEVEQIYSFNATRPLRVIPSEFCDMVAVDPLTNNIQHLAEMVGKIEGLYADIRTKSNSLEAIKSFPGHGKLTFTLSVNTEHVISHHEHGTASLDERLHAARTVQEADGYNLSLVIEPVIWYDGFKGDYLSLVDKISNAVDLSRVKRISLGSARYRKQLKERILRNHPATTLFDVRHRLQEPAENDFRLRYSIEFLADIYSDMIKEIRKRSSVPISLGAEKPELWDKLQFDKTSHISKNVYQYSGKIMGKQKEEIKTKLIEESEDESESANLEGGITTQQYLCALSAIQSADDDIDPVQFQRAVREIDQLEHYDDSTDEDNSVQTGYNLWDTIDPVTIVTARTTENLWHPVKIVGRIFSINEAIPMFVSQSEDDKEGGMIPTRVLEIIDKNQQKVQTLAFPESLLPENIHDISKSQRQVTIYGCCIYVQHKNKRNYRFYLHKISFNPSMGDLVEYRSSKAQNNEFTVRLTDGSVIGIPQNHPYLIVEKYGYSVVKNNSGRELLEYIRNSVMTNLKIMGSSYGADHLEKGIEFVILQSLSQGMSDGFSNKLHGFIIGPPNVGKSLLTDAAKKINPISEEMGVISAKQTSAGSIGSVRNIKGKSQSTGGIFPSTSGGVVCIQDFHQLKGGARSTLFGLSSLMMEKGVVRDDTSANATLRAEVSLLIDTNRYHQVEKQNPPEPFSYADLDVPVNILSRFDFIMEIPESKSRQDQVSEAFSLSSTPQNNDWVNQIKTLIAFLRDNYGYGITVSDEINEYSRVELLKLFAKYRTRNLEEAIADHRIRIQRSLKKYIMAVARAWARPVITKDHIDYAMTFIEQKVQFISKQINSETQTDGRSKRKRERSDIILESFIERQFTTQEVKALYKSEYPNVSERIVQRDLDSLSKTNHIRRVKHGVWQVINKEQEGDAIVTPSMPKPVKGDKKIKRKPIKRKSTPKKKTKSKKK
jgi:DNA repair photolyase